MTIMMTNGSTSAPVALTDIVSDGGRSCPAAELPKQQPTISSPLHLFGLYLAATEVAFALSLRGTDVGHWARDLLICAMSLGLVAYITVAGFTLVYLVVHRPELLFNPSDFDKSVQHLLFETGVSISRRVRGRTRKN